MEYGNVKGIYDRLVPRLLVSLQTEIHPFKLSLSHITIAKQVHRVRTELTSVWSWLIGHRTWRIEKVFKWRLMNVWMVNWKRRGRKVRTILKFFFNLRKNREFWKFAIFSVAKCWLYWFRVDWLQVTSCKVQFKKQWLLIWKEMKRERSASWPSLWNGS